MAYPGTYNFSYYRGDTLEFNIYPKNSAGGAFSLLGYDVNFSIATARGIAPLVTPYAAISADNSYITCVITPSDGVLLDAGTPYVYDVEINNLTAPNYPRVYTVLTGDITVQEQVTDIPLDIVEVPNAVTGLTITESPALTVNVSWTAPATGDPATSYNIYGKAPGLGVTNYVLITNIPITSLSTNTVFGQPFLSGATYDIKVTSVNSAGENTTSFAEGSVTIA